MGREKGGRKEGNGTHGKRLRDAVGPGALVGGEQRDVHTAALDACDADDLARAGLVSFHAFHALRRSR
jgi:hypothetical protein